MGTRVVHVNDNVPGAVYIGRANRWKGLPDSPFRNPYLIGYDGSRADVIDRYEEMIRSQMDRWPSTQDALAMLAGKPLACWCRHDGEERTSENACHGDVLIKLIEELGLEGGAA